MLKAKQPIRSLKQEEFCNYMTSNTNNRENNHNFYKSREEALSKEVERLKSHNKLFITAEIAEFMAIVALVIIYFATAAGEQTLWVAAALLVVYLITRHADARNSRITEAKEAQRQVYLGELRYLSGDFSSFNNGTRYSNPHHPFTFDLDIFGPDSLYQRICRCTTTAGRDMLAAALSSTDYHPTRGEAISELSGMEPFRTAFIASTGEQIIDCDKITSSLKALTSIEIPQLLNGKFSRIVVITDVIAYLIFVLATLLGLASAGIAVWWGVVNLCLSMGLSHKFLSQMHRKTDQTARQLGSLTRLITLIDAEDFHASELQELKDNLQGASVSFRQMFAMAHSLDSRANLLGLMLGNIFVLSDLRLVMKFAQWEQTNADSTDLWLNSIAGLDMLVSMSTFSYNEPSACKAHIEGNGYVEIKAQGLWHPFLGAKAVRNDFSISNGNFYIITGANMAGKSTFLRAVGINYVLAMNSMPVFAEQFSASKFNLFTSMRTTDDLTHGISYFNAELLRLKELMDNVAQHGATLIILDEILKGTNSLDKLNGSLLFLRTMLTKPVSGIVATHDLELSRLADEQPEHFHNFCFEIKIGQNITYSYKITPGVARNQNATFLLKKLLEDEKQQ